MLYAAIADDYTGGSDLAGMLAGQGVRTAQLFGVPCDSLVESLRGRYDAVVVCLKSRSIEPGEAVRLSLAALERLRPLEPRQIQFKYCSTFDSTARGNIGPVTEALIEALDAAFAVAVPALPINGRTQYLGCLFVNGVLLSESPMRDHPLNPMREPNLVRHLQPQTKLRVGLIAHPVVREGAASIQAEAARLKTGGVGIALVDAITEEDLGAIARAVAAEPLITGGSGITKALPPVWRELGWWSPGVTSPKLPLGEGRDVLLLAGSCSAATLDQIERYRLAAAPLERVDLDSLLAGRDAELDRLTGLTTMHLTQSGRCLVYSSAPAAEREETLCRLDARGHSAEEVRLAIEWLMGQLACRLTGGSRDVRRIVAAGGETSGAVLDALGVKAVEILDELDPGVPALRSLGAPGFGLALKSGNFGAPDFLMKAAGYLETL